MKALVFKTDSIELRCREHSCCQAWRGGTGAKAELARTTNSGSTSMTELESTKLLGDPSILAKS